MYVDLTVHHLVDSFFYCKSFAEDNKIFCLGVTTPYVSKKIKIFSSQLQVIIKGGVFWEKNFLKMVNGFALHISLSKLFLKSKKQNYISLSKLIFKRKGTLVPFPPFTQKFFTLILCARPYIMNLFILSITIHTSITTLFASIIYLIFTCLTHAILTIFANFHNKVSFQRDIFLSYFSN